MSGMSQTESENFTKKAKEAVREAVKNKKSNTSFWMKWASPELGQAAHDPFASFINFAPRGNGEPDQQPAASKSIHEIYRDLKDWAFNELNVGIDMEGMNGGSNVPIDYDDDEYLLKCRNDTVGKENIAKLTKKLVENIKNKKEEILEVGLKPMTGMYWHGMTICAFRDAKKQLNDTTTKLIKSGGRFQLQYPSPSITND